MDDFMESDPQGATVLAKFRVSGESELENLANCLAALCGAGDVLCLFGDLGAGKTSFARAFIRALTTPDQEVPSPTFTLVQVYETAKSPNSLAIWHADLYRLSDSQEVFELGLDDAFADALVLIEWPQRALEFLPLKRLEIHLSFYDKFTERSVVLRGDARWAGRLRGRLTMRAS